MSAARVAVGLMSGTSADGVDAALVRIPPGAVGVEMLAFRSEPYPDELRERILLAGGEGGADTEEICSLHHETGEAFAAAALALLEEAGTASEAVDFVGSHGQTVRHLPEGGRGPRGLLLPSTLQIGDAAVIAERTGLTVVADFRARDVAAGGSGAPLTPWAHARLFAGEEAPSAFVNLGGISNLTYLPPGGREGVVGFDCGPANMALDLLMEKLSGGKEHFDRDGALAARGRVDEGALETLHAHPFLARRPPKSTGREAFGAPFVEEAAALLEKRGGGPEDLMATLTAFSAECVLRAIRDHLPREAHPAELIVGGGGIHNRTLIARLAEGIAPVPVVSSAERGLAPDAVEAAAFALLAWAGLRGEPANVPAATGARRKAVLGHITPGRGFRRLMAAMMEEKA